MTSSPRGITYINSKQEPFRLYVFEAPQETPTNDAVVLLCVHGAGMSGRSFSKLARSLHSSSLTNESTMASKGVQHVNTAAPVSFPTAFSSRPMPFPSNLPIPPSRSFPAPSSQSPSTGASSGDVFVSCGPSQSDFLPITLVSYDLRCHGESTYEGGESNLTMKVLADDFINILQHVQRDLFPRSQIYILGHSLGAAILTNGLALPEHKPITEHVSGVILVDVVEGTAKESLKYMPDFLACRPTNFASIKDAEKWFLQHGGMHSAEGAALSVPPLLRKDPLTGLFVWRTNLFKMQEVWGEWFEGLDKAFVSLPVVKMLCLANAERLDKELMVAQMQGKFQLEVMGNGCGHYVMDDASAELSAKIQRFVNRIKSVSEKLNSRVQPRMPIPINKLLPKPI